MSIPWLSSLPLQTRRRGTTPVLALAGRAGPPPDQVIGQLGMPAEPRQTWRSESTAEFGDGDAVGGSSCSCKAPGGSPGAHAGSCGLFTSSFCYFSIAAPEGSATQGLPGSYTPYTPHGVEGRGQRTLRLIVFPQASVSESPPLLCCPHPTPRLAALPTPFPLASASSLPLRGLGSFHLLLPLVAIAVQRAGGGNGGRVRGAGSELAASAGPRPIRSAPPPPRPPARKGPGQPPGPGGAADRAGSSRRVRPRTAAHRSPGTLPPRDAAVGRRPRPVGRSRSAWPSRPVAAAPREARRRSEDLAGGRGPGPQRGGVWPKPRRSVKRRA